MAGFTNMSGSATVTLSAPATATGPALSVDVNTPSTPSENPHTISPYVYGMNGYVLDSASEKIANPGIVRWGGDDTRGTTTNSTWTNSAADWYFENFSGGGGSMFPNAGGARISRSFPVGRILRVAAALGTVPVLGWVVQWIRNTHAASQRRLLEPGWANRKRLLTLQRTCGNGVYAERHGG